MSAQFEALPLEDKRQLILKFLDAYGEWSFNDRQQMMKIVKHNGVEWALDWKFVSREAANYLSGERLYSAKFAHLIKLMKEKGMADMYHFLMGEPIDKAIK